MKFLNPTGKKRITLTANEERQIEIEDFAPGSRTFELTIVLEGQQAKCEIKGRAQSQNQDHKQWKITQILRHENQVGKIKLCGTAEHQSQLVFDGRAQLEATSKNADIAVHEKIWLFDQAQGRSLPILNVLTDQIKSAHHSATITPIEEALLFYLQTRGISLENARSILKDGFLH